MHGFMPIGLQAVPLPGYIGWLERALDLLHMDAPTPPTPPISLPTLGDHPDRGLRPLAHL